MASSSVRLTSLLHNSVACAAEAGGAAAAILRCRGGQSVISAALPAALRLPQSVGTPPPHPGFAGAIGSTRSYSEEVLDHFQNPRNVGAFAKNEPNVGTALVGKAACGDVIKLQVKVQDGVICDAKFKTFGCGSAIASSSYATELIKGKTPEAALGVTNKQISDHLNLPPVKLHCSLLAEDAVRLAIRDYEEKEKQRREGGGGAEQSRLSASSDGSSSGSCEGGGGGLAKKGEEATKTTTE